MFKKLLVILCFISSFTELTPAFWQRIVQRGRPTARQVGNILRTGLESRSANTPRVHDFPQARQPYTNTHQAQAATHATASNVAMHAQNREEFRQRLHEIESRPDGALVLNLADLADTDDQEDEFDDNDNSAAPNYEEEDWENESELRPLRSQTHSATPHVATENENGLAALLTRDVQSPHVVNRFQHRAPNAEATAQEQEAAAEIPHQIPVIVIQEEADEEQAQPMAAAPGPEVTPQNQLALVPYQGAPAQTTPHEANSLDEFANLTFPRFTHDDHYFVDNARTNHMYEEAYTAPARAEHAAALYDLSENMRALALSTAGAALVARNPARARQAFARATRRFLTHPPQRALPAPAQPRQPMLPLHTPRAEPAMLPLPRPRPRALPIRQPNILLNEGALNPDIITPPRRPLALQPGAPSPRTIINIEVGDAAQALRAPRTQNSFLPETPAPRTTLPTQAPQQPQLALPAPTPQTTLPTQTPQQLALPEPTPPNNLPLRTPQLALPEPVQPAEAAPENMALREMHARDEIYELNISDFPSMGQSPRQPHELALPEPAQPTRQPNIFLNEGALQPDLIVPPRRPLALQPGAPSPRTIINIELGDAAQALRAQRTQNSFLAEAQTPGEPRIPRATRSGNSTNTNRPGFAPHMPLTQRPIIHTAAAFPHREQTPPTQTAATPLEEFLPTMVRNNNPVPNLPTADQNQANDAQEKQSRETQTDTTPKEEKPVKDRPVIEEDNDDDDEVSPAAQKTKKNKKSDQAAPTLDTPEQKQSPTRAESAKPTEPEPEYEGPDKASKNTGDGVTIVEDNHPANHILATPQEKTPPVAIISTIADTGHDSKGQGQEIHLFIPKPCPEDKIYKKDKRPGMLQYEKSGVQERYNLQKADVTATYSETFKEIFDRLKNLASSLFEALVGPTRP